jgi:hypothetical protein
MAHGKDVHLDDNIQIGDEASSFGKKAITVGIIALVLGAALGGGPLGKQFSVSYLIAYMYGLALGLGMLWFVTIQHLTNAKWSVVVRRVAEIIAANMGILAILAIPVLVPIFIGHSELYQWADPAKVAASKTLQHKAGYLSVGFFAVRCVVYFGFWSLLSRHFLKASVAQDASGNPEISGKLQSLSAPSMVLFVLTLTFCAFDLLMSVDPDFASTIFGVYYFAGCVSVAYSFLALSLMWLQGKGRLLHTVNREHYHDLGKMMFAFVIFWSYIAFSQFMLIWYGDVPEETHWFRDRFSGDWLILSYGLLACHFAIPFAGLMSRHVKRNRKTLAFWAFWLLALEWFDIYWLVMPSFSPGVIPFHIVDLLCWVGVVSVFVGGAATRAKGLNLVPTKDPRLAASLAFQNV